MTPPPTPTPTPRPAPQGEALRWTGATLIFIAEVLMLLALAWWGVHVASGFLQLMLAIGVPVTVAVVWSLGLAPRARLDWDPILRIGLRTVLLALGAAAFFAVGAPVLGTVQIVLIVVGTVLTWGWEPPRHPHPVDEPTGTAAPRG